MTNLLDLSRSLKLCARCIVMMDKLPTSFILGLLHEARPKLHHFQAIVLLDTALTFSRSYFFTHLLQLAWYNFGHLRLFLGTSSLRQDALQQKKKTSVES